MLALSTMITSNGSAKRFMDQSGMLILLKAASSGAWKLVQAAAIAVQSILSHTDSDGSRYFAKLMSQFLEYDGVEVFRQYMLRGGHVQTVRECMKVWRSLRMHEDFVSAMHEREVLDAVQERADESISNVILKAEAALTIAAFSQMLPDQVKPMHKFILAQTSRCFESALIEERTIACFCVLHTAWDDEMRKAIFNKHSKEIQEMLKERSVLSREAAAAALEGICANDEHMADMVTRTRVSERLYQMLNCKHEAGIAQAARTLGSLARWDEGLEAVVKEMKRLGKKEGARPLLNTMQENTRSPSIQGSLGSYTTIAY
eukprot:1350402-Rhodomonas_salina.1